MSDDAAQNDVTSGVHLAKSLERIHLTITDGEIEFVKELAGQTDKFRDSFSDGPTWRDTFGDGGQWQSSFNNMRRSSDSARHPAIQEALQKVAAAIARSAINKS